MPIPFPERAKALTCSESGRVERTSGAPLAVSSVPAAMENQEWRSGWDPLPARAGDTHRPCTIVTLPVAEHRDSIGDENEALCRTLFAVLFSVLSGADTVTIAVDSGTRTLHIDPHIGIKDLVRRWEPVAGPFLDPRDQTGSHDLTNLRRFSMASRLPTFTFCKGTGSHEQGTQKLGELDSGTSELAALHCHVRETGTAAVWTLTARPDVADAVLLTEFADRIVGVHTQLGAGGNPNLVQLGAAIRQLTFDVNVLAFPGMGDAIAAIAAWGRAVRLPVRVRRVEPEQAHGLGHHKSGSGPRPWAANIAVVTRGVDIALDDLTGINENETRELYDEIVTRNCYLRHGVQIGDGDRIVDVGANIGMFTRFAVAQADNVYVDAFEPVPELADVLEANTRHLGDRVTVARSALGARAEQRSITHYPKSSLQSGFYTHAGRDEGIVRQYALQRYSRQRLRGSGTGSSDREQLDLILEPEIRAHVADSKQMDVQVLRLSDWITRNSIERVHLLKVDAERAEEDVLAGIDAHHWGRIEQVVAEVHDHNGRLERIRELLHRHGFVTHTEQDELFVGSEIFMMYARRPGPPRPPARWLRDQIATASRWSAATRQSVCVAAATGSTDEDIRQARDLAWEHGLTWIGGMQDETGCGSLRCTTSDTLGPDMTVLRWAEQVLRVVTASQRPVAKAVLVDADNTLWGGICGEVGPEHVDVGGPYRDVQALLARQRQAGRALVLCSRNNPDDVAAVFANHPDMPLRLDDFTAVHANWSPKSAAVAAVIADLGFAPESQVFVDDNPAERAEVSLAYPDITVVDLPDDPAGFLAALHGTWQLALDADLTAEDRGRAELFADETRRRAAAAQVRTVAEFLHHLALEVHIADAMPGDADRVAQLAARTTQFNLALRSRTPAEVCRLIGSDAVTLSVRVRDRFGDYGLVGFACAEPDVGCLRIRDFLLSCRALGRNVEWSMLQELGARARHAGLPGIIADKTAGPRNRPACEFLSAAVSRLSLGAHAVDASAAAELDWRTVEVHGRLPGTVAVSPGPAASSVARRAWPVSAAAARAAAQEYERPRAVSTCTPYTAPEPGTEQLIAAVWEQVLGVQPVGAHDDLFALGGDSLAAAAICMRLREHPIAVTLHDLLTHPTVRSLASHLRHAAATILQSDPEPGVKVPASAGQQRVWAAEMIGGCGNAQTIPAMYRITGDLDVPRLQAALTVVVRRHAALRTTLTTDGCALVQVTATASTGIDLPVRNLWPDSSAPRPDHCHPTTRPASPVNELVAQAARAFFDKPIDLQRDLMLRAELLNTGISEQYLLIVMHHSAADGQSADLLRRDLSAAYHDPGATQEPAVAFTAYCAEVRRRQERGEFTAAASVAARLSHGPVTSWSVPGGGDADPRHLWFPLSATLTAAVHSTARRYGTIPFTVYLAAYQVALAALTGPGTLVTGCPMANRNDPQFADTVGFLANIVPVAFPGDWNGTVSDLLTAAAGATAEAVALADVPYGLVAERYRAIVGSDGPALFDTMFTLQPPTRHPMRLDGCIVTMQDPPIWPLPYPLMLDVQDDVANAAVLLRYDAAAYHPVSPPWMAQAYPLLLDVLCTVPALTLARIRRLLTASDELDHLIRARLRAIDRKEGDVR